MQLQRVAASSSSGPQQQSPPPNATSTSTSTSTSTNMFYMDPDIHFMESGDVKPTQVNCYPLGNRNLAPQVAFFFHSVFQDGPWPTSTNLPCYNCCHPFTTPPVPIVNGYDVTRNRYNVALIFCSCNCAKRYLLTEEPLISSQRLVLFNDMCCQVFGIKNTGKPAPPRLLLKFFCGADHKYGLTIDEYRKDFVHFGIDVRHPPFIQQAMCVCGDPSGQKDIGPPPTTPLFTGLFGQFVQSKLKKDIQQTTTSVSSSTTTTTTNSSPSTSTAALSVPVSVSSCETQVLTSTSLATGLQSLSLDTSVGANKRAKKTETKPDVNASVENRDKVAKPSKSKSKKNETTTTKRKTQMDLSSK